MIQVIDELVEDALRELSDERAQRRLWLASRGPEVSSFTECTGRLWTDSGLADALDKADVLYTRSIDDKLRQLGALLRKIDDSRPPDAVLDDPRLAKARSHARALLEDLRSFGIEQARG